MNKKKTVPATSRKVLRPETKPTLRQRAKALVKRAAGAITRAASRVKTFVKKAAVQTKVVAIVGWAKARKAWRETLRPFLKITGLVCAGVTWTSMLLIAPAHVVAATAVAGALLIGLASLLEWLDRVDNRASHFAIAVIEYLGQALRAAFYLSSAAVVIMTIPAWAPVFIAYALVSVIIDVLPMPANNVPAPTLLEDLDVPAVTRRAQDADVRPHSPAHAVDLGLVADAKPHAIRATGAEEMFDMPACEACGSIEGALRARSHDEARALLCSECYDLECEENALRYTGISLKKTSVEVRLNNEGLKTMPEYAASLVDADHVHWTRTPTSSWRDKNGDLHGREWTCFHAGTVVATVRFDYRRAVYRATTLGKVVGGPQRSLQAAQRLASDALFDEGNAVTRLVENMGQLAATPAPASIVPIKVG